MSSEADRARAADQVSRAEMAESVWKQLTRNLELMTKEQRKQFQQRLPDQDLRQHSPGATTSQPEKLDGLEMASRLVAQYGEKKAWDLALQTWKQMGLSELCARVPDKAALESDTTEKYQKQKRESPSPPQSWKNEDFHPEFTHLLLLHRRRPSGYDFLLKSDFKVVGEQRYYLQVRDLFGFSLGFQEESPTVVLYGVAGIGKSTVARQVRRVWEEGRQFRDHFQHVFYFNCRELAQLETMSLAELITKDWAGPMAPIEQILSQPKKLLFILDNLDETKLDLEQHRSEFPLHWSQKQQVYALLGSLLKKTLVPEASLLITARVTALGKLIPSLQQPRWVEVLGFSESTRKEYFHRYFTAKGQANMAFKSVRFNPALMAMCFNPLVSWLVCTCLKQHMDQRQELVLTSQTITDLCLHYFFHVLQAQSLGTKLRGFCALAAEATQQGKTLFSPGDLREHGLEEDTISTLLKMGILRKHFNSLSYRFIHLCFQEFFAAMSCALGDKMVKGDWFHSSKSVRELTEGYDTRDLFGEPTTRFLFGLLSEPGMREMESIFKCKLSRDRHCRLLSLAKQKFQDKHENSEPYCSYLLHCFYEIQDERFLREAISHFYGGRICVQTDMELLVFTFCIKFGHCIKRLQLNEGGPHRQAQEPSGVVLSSLGPFTDSGWKMFFSILQVPGSLKELDLSGNFLNSSVINSLCEALKCHHCHLETLRLVKCGLTSGCCKDLVSMLSANPSLTELDLQQNNLGDLGMKVLCEGLRLHTCQLRLLRLDQTQQSEEVTEMLRVLHLEKPELLVDSGKTSSPGGKQMDEDISPLKWQKPESEESCSQGQKMVTFYLYSEPLRDLPVKPLGTKDVFRDPTVSLATEVVDKDRSLYRVHFPMAGFYPWKNTGFHFEVRKPVTIEIEFCAWKEFLNQIIPQHSWMVVGPLFHIQAEPGAVAAVYVPHFVDLQGEYVDKSCFQVAHIKKEGIFLEKPARVESHYVVLENPSFSPMILLRKIQTALRIPISANVLLYHHLHHEEVTFHLYLIPNDCSIRKAIDDEEKKFKFVQIHKPQPLTPFYMGSRYTVSGSQDMVIIPQEQMLCYQSPGEPQHFCELHIGHLRSSVMLYLRDKEDGTVVWEALVKSGDLRPEATLLPPCLMESPALLHFVDRHREQLVARVASVDPVLDKLYGRVLSDEQYESVRAEPTNPDRMRKLFSFSKAWNRTCKDQLYQALKETHPHLIVELQGKWGHGGD